jgi:hypothetical protein
MFEHKPGFYIYDTANNSLLFEEVPHKPADEVLSREHIRREEEKNEMLDSFIKTVQAGSVKGGVSFKENLMCLMDAEGVSSEVRKIVSDIIGKE